MRKDVRQVVGKTVVNQAGKGVCTLVMALFFLGAGPAAHAFPITPLDLTDLDANDRPQGWTYAIQGTTSVGVITRDGEDYLEMHRSASTGVAAAMFWDGNETITNGSFGSDLSGSVVLRQNARGYVFGAVLGAQNKTFTNSDSTNHQGYHVGIIPRDLNGDLRGLGIWYNRRTATSATPANTVGYDADAPDPFADAAFSAFSPDANLDTADTFLLEFSVNGSIIGADLWRLDANDQKTGDVIASLSHTMSSNVEGYFGLLSGRHDRDNTSAHFRDLTLIPEPSTALTGLLGAALLWLRLRRRSTRA